MTAEMITQIRAAMSKVTRDEEGVLRANFCFSPDFCGFAGHFPGAPILPALVQLLLAQEVICRQQGPLVVAAIKGAKFKRPLRPQEQIEVCCRPRSAEKGYKVELQVAGSQASSFTLGI